LAGAGAGAGAIGGGGIGGRGGGGLLSDNVAIDSSCTSAAASSSPSSSVIIVASNPGSVAYPADSPAFTGLHVPVIAIGLLELPTSITAESSPTNFPSLVLNVMALPTGERGKLV